MKRNLVVTIEDWGDDENAFVPVIWRVVQVEFDDDQPYSLPDEVVANAVRNAVRQMFSMQTRPQEGGR